MKRIISILLTALLLFLLPACAKARHYRDDISGKKLAELALRAPKSDSGYSAADAHFLDDYFLIPSYVTDHAVHFSSDGSNLNELGVFHVQNGHAEELKDTLRGYLSESLSKNQAWYNSYIPEEIPKLRDAEVRIYGNYVVYAIFDKDDRAAVFDSVEQTLTES